MLSVVATKKLVLSAAMAVLMHVNVAWCDSCGEMYPAEDLAEGYCEICQVEAMEREWCDCCGNELDGSDWIVCDCHGIHGNVCTSCADWHKEFE